jgi:hypothetical protein
VRRCSATAPPTRPRGSRTTGPRAGGAVTCEVRVEEVTARGPIAAVHDVWTGTQRLPGAAAPVRRVIRGSEQPDGQGRIARYVSAPEPWAPVR